MLKSLKRGDRVLTTGGIIGTVVDVDDQKAVLKIANDGKSDVKVEFSKGAIVQVMAAETK
jgi:preprotein translocase subunit YajC